MRGKKEFSVLLIVALTIILILLLYQTGLPKKMTGFFSTEQTVALNITVGVPYIVIVHNESENLGVLGGLNEGTSNTNISINFTAYNGAGNGVLNHSTARINFTKATGDTRENLSCQWIAAESSGNYANYTCTLTMWWWDLPGTWNITAYIEDNSSNKAQNVSTTFYVGTTTGFVMSPPSLTWAAISAGSINQTSNNDPLLLNNTGNVGITAGNIQVNATNLRGETTNTIALWAENFSIGFATGTNAECAKSTSTILNRTVWASLDIANLTAGNFIANNNFTGQETLFFCLRTAGTELESQAYSTMEETSWTIKIV